jgi:hypothetical protein
VKLLPWPLSLCSSNIAAQQQAHLPRNGQTQTGAAELPAGAGVHLLECVEDVLNLSVGIPMPVSLT